MRSRAQTIAIILSRFKKRIGAHKSFAAQTPSEDAPLSAQAIDERNRIQHQHAPPDWANDDYTDTSEAYGRVMWGLKAGDDIETNSLGALDVLDNAKAWRGMHITSDEDYWTDRLVEDYGRDRETARNILIRPDKHDFLVEDPQYTTDPDTGDKADSAILITTRPKLVYGIDWIFEGEEWGAVKPKKKSK